MEKGLCRSGILLKVGIPIRFFFAFLLMHPPDLPTHIYISVIGHEGYTRRCAH